MADCPVSVSDCVVWPDCRLPQPALPSFVNVSSYGFECVVVGIVAFAQSVSLAVLMAKKHHYDIDSNKVSPPLYSPLSIALRGTAALRWVLVSLPAEIKAAVLTVAGGDARCVGAETLFLVCLLLVCPFPACCLLLVCVSAPGLS